MQQVSFSPYVFIGLLSFVAIVFAVAPLVIARILSPKKPGKIKSSTYECGIESSSDAWVQFRIQYYLYALLFVVFDSEIVFLYPWAVVWRSFGLFALVEMLIFIAILAVGLVYAWRKGVLEWR